MLISFLLISICLYYVSVINGDDINLNYGENPCVRFFLLLLLS